MPRKGRSNEEIISRCSDARERARKQSEWSSETMMAAATIEAIGERP